jgi:hypothetical protein
MLPEKRLYHAPPTRTYSVLFHPRNSRTCSRTRPGHYTEDDARCAPTVSKPCSLRLCGNLEFDLLDLDLPFPAFSFAFILLTRDTRIHVETFSLALSSNQRDISDVAHGTHPLSIRFQEDSILMGVWVRLPVSG